MTITTYRTSKHRLLRHFPELPARFLVKTLNGIVAEKRNMAYADAKQKQYLNSNEVTAFLECIGEPLQPYGRIVELPSTPIKKTVLKNLLSPMNDRYFYRMANMAVKSEGQRSPDRLGRYLFHNEVMRLLGSLGEALPERT